MNFKRFYILIVVCLMFLQHQAMGQRQDVLLLDDFDVVRKNAFDGTGNAFGVDGATIDLSKAEVDLTPDNSPGALVLAYNVGVENSFAFYASPYPNIDLSDFDYLSFWIKGEMGGEYVQIQLATDTEVAKVAVWNYLDGGPTQDWQQVVIPLRAFYNLTSFSGIREIVFVMENFQGSTNESPLQSRILLDELVVGSFDTGYVRVDHFSDLLDSNALGGNNGIFSSGSPDNYGSSIECDTTEEGKVDCHLELSYNATAEASFGGLFMILGGGDTGFDPIYQSLERYSSLQMAIWSPFSGENPGNNVMLELKGQFSTHTVELPTIDDEYSIVNLPFDSFSPPIGNTPIGELTLVFSFNTHNQNTGRVLIDDIGFKGEVLSDVQEYELSILENGNPFDFLKELSSALELEIATLNEPFIESVVLEKRAHYENSWSLLDREYSSSSMPFRFTINPDDVASDAIMDFRASLYRLGGVVQYSDMVHASQAPYPKDMEGVFRDSYDYFASLRLVNGVYRDALRIDGNHFAPVSVATTGMGLVALTIADRMGWINDAAEQVKETLESMTGKTPGFAPDHTPNGYFRHFIDPATGAQAWDSEYSTIDTAILVAGALFAKKYFSEDTEIASLADELWLSIDWSTSIDDPVEGSIFREIDNDGSGIEDVITLPFNEYIIVAWLATLREGSGGGKATELWERHYANPDSLEQISYGDIPVLTDNVDRHLPNFTLQFAYFLCNYFTTNNLYLEFMDNARRADQEWWLDQGAESYQWGLGAGSAPSGSGYHADAINENEDLIYSPHIIAGFLPVYPDGIGDLQSLLKRGNVLAGFQDIDTRVLWRASLEDPYWQAEDVQGIDYSSMLLGLAAWQLGSEFFVTNNDFAVVRTNVDVEKPIEGFSLEPNFPNPVTKSTTIRWTLSEAQEVQLVIFDLLGRKVEVLANGVYSSGTHSVKWVPDKVANGTYFYRLISGGTFLNRKLVLMNDLP